MKIIPYGRQQITDKDIQAVVETLKSDFLTQGPKVLEFEEKFARYVDARYAVAVANGTAALHLSALALGVNNKTKVITTPMTFSASANCVLYCGGKVVFADIDPKTALLDFSAVKNLVSNAPKGTYNGIVAVDYAGLPVNLEPFRKLADEYGLWIIEDACHAPGGHFTDSKGKMNKCGNAKLAEIAVFSFHPVKHIATGEGGMITTNDQKIYQKLLKLRTHGITKDATQLEKNDGGWFYEMQDLGYNYRLPDILCALGISQLEQAEERLKKRASIARKYDEAFSSVEYIKPLSDACELLKNGTLHAYHLYVIRTPKRKQLYDFLKEKGIHAQVHYVPVHKMPYYRESGYSEIFPEAERFYEECLSLPMYPTLSQEEQDHVIQTIKEFTKSI